MKISINTLRKLSASSIADAIEKIAQEHDSIASGIIGPSFATSGPGPGWSRQYDVTDYAKRALADDYGAASYIDSSDGREATLNDEMLLEWSDESVVEIELPSVEEALGNPSEWEILKSQAADYGADADEIEALAEKTAAPYRLSDGMAIEYAASVEGAASIAEDWYDFLVNDGKIEELPAPDLDTGDLDDLCSSVSRWENEIAEAMGKQAFHGHGNYSVSAADRAGLNLSITIRD